MDHTKDKLETLFAAVRELPEPEQLAAVEALSEIANAPYQLSSEELAVLRPALDRASRQDYADEQSFAELLKQPWRKSNPAADQSDSCSRKIVIICSCEYLI